MKKKVLLIVAFIIAVILGCLGYYHSTSATTNRLVSAIQDKDLKTVKKYLPEYSDHTKISNQAYQAFVVAKPSAKQIKKILNSECHFVDHGWLGQKYWEPKKRILSFSGMDDVDGTTVSLEINHHKISIGKNNNQYFLPGNYHFKAILQNSAYGTIKQKEDIDLISDNQNIVFSPVTDFEKSGHLHKLLLASYSMFLASWNQSIPTMDFSNLKCVTNREKKTMSDEYNTLKDVMSSYSNEFGKVTIDNSTIQIKTLEDQPTVEFTAYVQRQQSVKIDKDQLDADKDLNIGSDEGTADVIMIYSAKTGHWEVDDADFNVDDENPKDWNDKTSFDIPQRYQQAKWQKDTSNV